MDTLGSLLMRWTAPFIRLMISLLAIAPILGIQSSMTIEGRCSQMREMISSSSFPLPEKPRLINGQLSVRLTILPQAIPGREAHAPWAIEVPYRMMGLSPVVGTKEKLVFVGTPISS